MKALPTDRGESYLYCDGCDQYRNTEEWSTQTVYVHNVNDQIDSGSDSFFYFDSDCWSEETMSCDYCGHRDDSPNEISSGWYCDECSEVFEDKNDADSCCT